MAAGSTSFRSSLTAVCTLVGLLTFAVAALAIDARATYGARVTADEPQYLTTALSLAEDFDLDISDEIEEEAFLPYHEIRLNQQTIDLNDDGQRISPHDPLLPLLLAPAMGVGGWVGAKLMLAALGGLAAALTTWLAVRRFGVSTSTAALVVGAFFCAPPLTSYGTQVYPELPAALAVVIGVIALTGDRRTTAANLVAILAIVALPWLAVKYVPVAAVLGIALLFPYRRLHGDDRRTVALITGVLALSGVIYLVVHQRIYGGWTVYAAGDHFVNGEFLVVGSNANYIGRTRRLVGLLIDREFGLIPWTPSFLLALPAMVLAVRRPLPHRWLMLGLVGAGWAVATWVALTMHGWWWPGRQVVVILPLVVVAIAAAVDRRPWLRAATVIGTLLGTMSWLWLVWEASTDRRTLIVDFVDTTNPWYQAWSTLFPDQRSYGVTGGNLVITTLWTIGLLAVAAAVWRNTEPTGPADSAGVDEERDEPDQPAASSAVVDESPTDEAPTDDSASVSID
ncbi:MAG: hypothetical protein AAGD35_03535 [Actinomycetota bacterium]